MQRAAQSLISIMRIRSRMMCEILSNRCESGEKKKVAVEDNSGGFISLNVCAASYRGLCFITVPWLSLHRPLQHTSQRLLIIHWVLVVPLRPARCCRNPALHRQDNPTTPPTHTPTHPHPRSMWRPTMGKCSLSVHRWWIREPDMVPQLPLAPIQ